jgi:hypothetical protein
VAAVTAGEVGEPGREPAKFIVYVGGGATRIGWRFEVRRHEDFQKPDLIGRGWRLTRLGARYAGLRVGRRWRRRQQKG